MRENKDAAQAAANKLEEAAQQARMGLAREGAFSRLLSEMLELTAESPTHVAWFLSGLRIDEALCYGIGETQRRSFGGTFHYRSTRTLSLSRPTPHWAIARKKKRAAGVICMSSAAPAAVEDYNSFHCRSCRDGIVASLQLHRGSTPCLRKAKTPRRRRRVSRYLALASATEALPCLITCVRRQCLLAALLLWG